MAVIGGEAVLIVDHSVQFTSLSSSGGPRPHDRHFSFRARAFFFESACQRLEYRKPKSSLFWSSMPDGSTSSKRVPTFNTLAREKAFKSPPEDGSTYNILNEFVAPHIESFNALFDDSGLPAGDGDGRGLLSLALKDIGDRVVFDGLGDPKSESGISGWGNRMRSECSLGHWIMMFSTTFAQFGLNR